MNRLHRAVVWILVVCPVAWVAWTCGCGPTIPQNDYWIYFNNIVDTEGFSSSPGEWMARHNNHLLTGAYLVYGINLKLTNGSNRGLAFFSWACALGILIVLGIWIRRVTGDSERLFYGLLIASSWLIFSPLLSMFWFMGFSGVHTLGSVLLCLIAIEFWSGFQRSRSLRPLIACSATTIMALAFFSSSLPLFPLLAFAAIFDLRRYPRCLSLFLVFLALVLFVWLAGYQTQPSDPITLPMVVSLFLFPFAFIGSALTRSIEVAIGVGILGAAVTVALLAHRRRDSSYHRSSVDTQWWMLLGFAGGNALLTAVVRSTSGLETAFASRYSIFPVLFWIALGVFVSNAARRTIHRRMAVIVVCVIAIASQLNGRSYFLALERRARLEPALREAVQMGVEDIQGVNGVVTPWAGTFLRAIPTLRVHGWVPFDKAQPHNLRIKPSLQPPPGIPKAMIWAHRALGDSVHRVAGRLEAPLPLQTALVMVDKSGLVLGHAATVPGRSKDSGMRSRDWIGYLRVSRQSQVSLTTISGEFVGRFRCCSPDRHLAEDVDPFLSPYPRWFNAGTYRSPWLRRLLNPR